MLIFSIALVVRDTDGSAFITKAEFDSLKNNFQAQIDNYNTSIDSKIDGAIASYLSGIKISTTEARQILFNDADVLCMDSTKQLRYKLGYSYVNGFTGKIMYQNKSAYAGTTGNFIQPRCFNIEGEPSYWNGDVNPAPYRKLLIKDIDVTKKIASWDGYEIDGREHVAVSVLWDTQMIWNSVYSSMGSGTTIGLNSTTKYDNSYNINGNTWTNWNSGGYFAIKNLGADYATGGYNIYMPLQTIEVKNVKQIYKNMFVYKNTENDEFQLNGIVTNNYYNNGTNRSGLVDSYKWLLDNHSDMVLTMDELVAWLNASLYNTQTFFGESNSAGQIGVQNNGTETWWRGERSAGYDYYAPLVQGFESGTNSPGIRYWNMIYNSSYDQLASVYNSKTSKPNSLLYDSDGSPHLCMTAGFPLIKVNKNEKVEYLIKQKGSFKKMDLYVKLAPFDKDVSPDAETDKSNFLTLTGDKGATFDSTKMCLTIKEDQTTISFDIPSGITEEYIWLKWCKNDTTTFGADEYGIELALSATATVTTTND